MSDIFKTLREKNIKTVESIQRFDFETGGFGGFSILAMLPSSDERGMTKVKDSIVRLDMPAVCDSKRLTIDNSIIIGGVNYTPEVESGNLSGDTSIIIKNSIVLGALTIECARMDHVELYGSSLDEIKICGCASINYFSIWQTKIISLVLESSYVKTFVVPKSSKVGSLSFVYSSVGYESNISLGAFCTEYLGKLLDNDAKKKLQRAMKLISPIKNKSPHDSEVARADIARWNTHGVLRRFAATEFSVDTYAKYIYSSCLDLSESKTERVFLWGTGAFYIPRRFIFCAILVWALFAIFYSWFPQSFTPCLGDVFSRNAILQAFYISGISFTTIGFGDIVPNGAMRFFIILEGCLGVLISSSFVVSLVKKYIEGKESRMIALSQKEHAMNANPK